MKMSRPMTDLELIKDAVKRFPGGFEKMEQLLDKGENVLYSEINPNITTHKLGFVDWKRTMDLTGDLRSLFKVCNEFGGVFVPIETFENSSGDDLAGKMSEYLREQGEAMTALAMALDDGTVSLDEARRIEKETWEAAAVNAAMAMICRKIIDQG